MRSVLRLESTIQEAVDARDPLGLSLSVVEGDEVVYARGFGITSVEDGRPVTPGTLFDVGSIAKTVLATLVMRLVDAGALDLDTPVVEYLPGFTFGDPGLGRKVTLRHLLSHTSGLPSAGKDRGPADADALARFVREQLARHSFVAEPGRVHLYSNTAITLAGYVAEAVTGRSYRELVQDLVCSPLAMARTTYEHAVAMTYPLALPHREGPDGSTLEVIHRWAGNCAGEPSGFLNSTVLDLANLAALHLNGGRFGGTQLLSTEAAAEMRRTVVEIPKLGARHPFAHLNAGYALGLVTGSYRGEKVLRHGGISQSYNCFFELMPDRRRGFVALTNWSRGSSRLIDLIVRLYDHLLMDLPGEGVASVEPPPPLVGEAHRRYWPSHDGTYINVGAGKLATVRVEEERLVVEWDDSVHSLVALSETDYYFEDPDEGRVLVSFLPEANASTEYLYLAGEPCRRFVPDPDFLPAPDTWRGYVGRYRDSSNLDPDSELIVRLHDDTLWLVGDGEEEACRPLSKHTFLSSWGLLEFVIEDGGNAPVLVVGKATRHERVGEDHTTSE